MRAMEITRLFDKIRALEARVEELERITSQVADTHGIRPLSVSGSSQKPSDVQDEKHFDSAHYSTDPDRLIVERWKAGGCLFCAAIRPYGHQYLCDPCAVDLENDDPREAGRLIALCDAAVKEKP